MPATPAWLAAVEAMLNRGITASARAEALARRLDGTALRLDVGVLSIRLATMTGRLTLTTVDATDAKPDAVVAGSPLALLRLRSSSGAAANGAGAAISGDAEVVNSYRELLMLARPDLEEELSRLLGDQPGRRLSLVTRQLIGWGRRALRTAGANVAEYLQEESRDLVNKPELDEFLRGVDSLREAVDRIDARLVRLERRSTGVH